MDRRGQRGDETRQAAGSLRLRRQEAGAQSSRLRPRAPPRGKGRNYSEGSSGGGFCLVANTGPTLWCQRQPEAEHSGPEGHPQALKSGGADPAGFQTGLGPRTPFFLLMVASRGWEWLPYACLTTGFWKRLMSYLVSYVRRWRWILPCHESKLELDLDGI